MSVNHAVHLGKLCIYIYMCVCVCVNTATTWISKRQHMFLYILALYHNIKRYGWYSENFLIVIFCKCYIYHENVFILTKKRFRYKLIIPTNF